MKRTKVKALLMLEDTFKSPLICHEFEVTSADYKKGMDHIRKKAALQIADRLTLIIDEVEINKYFG